MLSFFHADSPISRHLKLGVAGPGLSLSVVDVDLGLCEGGTAEVIALVDVDLLVVAAVSAAGQGGGEGRGVSAFVTFPSDARSLRG